MNTTQPYDRPSEARQSTDEGPQVLEVFDFVGSGALGRADLIESPGAPSVDDL